MKRALVALLLAPVFVGLLFGLYAIFAVPIMLAVTVLLALPMFLLFRHLRWLQWWTACAAGALCGFAFALFYWFTSPPYHVEYIGLRNAVLFVGMGAGVGILFWWLGVFGNTTFPFVSTRAPRSMLLVLPVALAGLWLYQRLEPHLTAGRVTALLQAPQSNPERSGRVQLRLADGSVVAAYIPQDLLRSSVLGQCFSLSERWSVTQSEKLYFLHAPKFGTGSDDC